MCSMVSLVISSYFFEIYDLDLNPAQFKGFNRVLTMEEPTMYSCIARQIHSSVPKHDEWK